MPEGGERRGIAGADGVLTVGRDAFGETTEGVLAFVWTGGIGVLLMRRRSSNAISDGLIVMRPARFGGLGGAATLARGVEDRLSKAARGGITGARGIATVSTAAVDAAVRRSAAASTDTLSVDAGPTVPAMRR